MFVSMLESNGHKVKWWSGTHERYGRKRKDEERTMRLDRLTVKSQEALQEAQARLANRRVTLKLTARAKSFLAREGYDPIYGARPLRRAVQKYLMDPLATRLLDGSLASNQTVTVDQNGSDGLSFSGT